MIKKAKEVGVQITLPPLNIKTAIVSLVGDSGLICHAWSQKAKQEMLDKHMKKAKTAKEAKDPHKDFLASLYPLSDANGNGVKYGFPAVAFKSAAVDACSQVDGLTKVDARASFHINGELVPIEGTPEMREDMVRIGMGTADIRHRGEFKQWRTRFTIRYNANVLSLEQILNLFNTAGFGIGVGEWRPQRDGSNGMFHVETILDAPTKLENTAKTERKRKG